MLGMASAAATKMVRCWWANSGAIGYGGGWSATSNWRTSDKFKNTPWKEKEGEGEGEEEAGDGGEWMRRLWKVYVGTW